MPWSRRGSGVTKENRQLKRQISKLRRQLEDKGGHVPKHVDPTLARLADKSAHEIDRILSELVDKRMHRTARQRGTAAFAPNTRAHKSTGSGTKAVPTQGKAAVLAAAEYKTEPTAEAAEPASPANSAASAGVFPQQGPVAPVASTRHERLADDSGGNETGNSLPAKTAPNVAAAAAAETLEGSTPEHAAERVPVPDSRRKSSQQSLGLKGVARSSADLEGTAPVLRRWSHMVDNMQQQSQQDGAEHYLPNKNGNAEDMDDRPETKRSADAAAMEELEGFKPVTEGTEAELAHAPHQPDNNDQGGTTTPEAEQNKPRRKRFNLRAFARRSSKTKSYGRSKKMQQQQPPAAVVYEQKKRTEEEASGQKTQDASGTTLFGQEEEKTKGHETAHSEEQRPPEKTRQEEQKQQEEKGQDPEEAKAVGAGGQEGDVTGPARKPVPPEVMERIFNRTASSRRDVSQRELSTGGAPVASLTPADRLRKMEEEKKQRRQQRIKAVQENLQAVSLEASAPSNAQPVKDDGSTNANDDAILAAMAHTNPNAYEEFRVRRSASFKATAHGGATLGTNATAALTTMPDHLYILAMVEAGVSEDNELRDRLQRRFFVHPGSGERVFRQEDVDRVASEHDNAAAAYDDDDDDDDDDDRRESMLLRDSEEDRQAAMMADLARRKAAAKERKRQAQLRRATDAA